jgi:hypothetical protein
VTALLPQAEVSAVCQRVVDAVSAAVALQFALPSEVLQHLVHCQTDACRARFAAGRMSLVSDPELAASLARFQRAASALQSELERRRK